MRKNRRTAFIPTFDGLESLALLSNVPFAFMGPDVTGTELITSQAVYDASNATFYIAPNSTNSARWTAPDGIVGHNNVPFMFRAVDNNDNPLYDGGNNPLFWYVVYDETTATFIVDSPVSPGYYTVADGTVGQDNIPFVTYAGLSNTGVPQFNFAVYDNTTGYFVVHQNAAPGYFTEELGTAGADNTPFVLWGGNQVSGLQLQGGTPVVYAVYNNSTADWTGMQWQESTYGNGQYGWHWVYFGGTEGPPGLPNTPFLSPVVNGTGDWSITYNVGPDPTNGYQFTTSVYDQDAAAFVDFSGTAYQFTGGVSDVAIPDTFIGSNGADVAVYQIYDPTDATFTSAFPGEHSNYSVVDGIPTDSNTPFFLNYPGNTSGQYADYLYAYAIYDADTSTFTIVPGLNTTLDPNESSYSVVIDLPG